MSGEVGESGWYVCNKKHSYGPFKSQLIAEFFNLIGFGSPRSDALKEELKKGVKKLETVSKAEHPNQLFGTNSQFSLWWKNTFEKNLTSEIVLKLAKETGAQGYSSFQSWLCSGCQVNDKHIMYYSEPDNN